MNELQNFNFENQQVRTLLIDNIPYFVGKDVAEVLGYSNPQKALRDHVDEEDKKMGERNVTPSIIDNLGREQFPVYINESGLYSLVLSSKLPSAKQFKRWITSEVLPSLRKTGSYQMTPASYIEALEALVASEKEKEAQRKQLELQAPKVEFYDAVAGSKDAVDLGSVAKMLGGIGRNRLFEFLRQKAVLMNNNQPYQRYVDNGCFRVIEQKYTKPDGTTSINIKTLVYQKGVDFIRKLLSTEWK